MCAAIAKGHKKQKVEPAAFVLPDVDLLNSPDWSSEDEMDNQQFNRVFRRKQNERIRNEMKAESQAKKAGKKARQPPPKQDIFDKKNNNKSGVPALSGFPRIGEAKTPAKNGGAAGFSSTRPAEKSDTRPNHFAGTGGKRKGLSLNPDDLVPMTEGASPNTPMADDAPPHYEHIKEIKSILASSTAKDTSPPTSTANRQVSLRSPTCTRTKETDSPHMEGSNYNLFTSSTHGRERKISFKKSGPYTTAPDGDGFDFPFDFHMPSAMANDGSTLQQRRLSYPQPMVSDRSKSQSVNSQMESEEYNTYMIEEIMAKYEADYTHSAVSRGSSQTHIDPGSDFSSVASGFNLSFPPETKTQHQRAEDDDRSDLQELCDEYDLDLDVDEYDLQAYAGTAPEVEPSLRRGVSLLESACLRRNYYSVAISVNAPLETLQKEETNRLTRGAASNYWYSIINRVLPVKEESNIKTIRPNVGSFSPTSEAKKMENKTCITSLPKRKEASDKKSPPAQVPPPGFTSVTAKKK